MSRFARGFMVRRSYDSWPFPFSYEEPEGQQNPLFFTAPITATSKKVNEPPVSPKKKKFRPVPLEKLKSDYKSYISLYQSEVAKYKEN